MSEPIRWPFEMTREHIPTLQLQLEWSLQHRNAQLAAAMRPEHHSRRTRGILRTVALLGLVALAAVYWNAPPVARDAELVWILPAAVVCLALLVRAQGGVAFRISGRRYAAQSLARTAARTFAKVAARAPYTVNYELAGTQLRSHAPAVAVDRTVDLRKIQLAHLAADVVCLYAGILVLPKRVVYGSGAALRAALVAAGVPCVDITGPVPGYGDPIPVAATR